SGCKSTGPRCRLAVGCGGGAGWITSALHETSAGHHCQTPNEMTRVSTVGTHAVRSTSTFLFTSRSAGPHLASTSSALISLISCVGMPSPMIGMGTIAITESSCHSLPEQCEIVVEFGGGGCLSSTSTCLVSAVQPLRASAPAKASPATFLYDIAGPPFL